MCDSQEIIVRGVRSDRCEIVSSRLSHNMNERVAGNRVEGEDYNSDLHGLLDTVLLRKEAMKYLVYARAQAHIHACKHNLHAILCSWTIFSAHTVSRNISHRFGMTVRHGWQNTQVCHSKPINTKDPKSYGQQPILKRPISPS
jgi:hypothetical protein